MSVIYLTAVRVPPSKMCNSVGSDKEMPPPDHNRPTSKRRHLQQIALLDPLGRPSVYSSTPVRGVQGHSRLVRKEHLCPIVDRPMNVFSEQIPVDPFDV